MKHEDYLYPWKTETDDYFILTLHPKHPESADIKNSITFYIETKKKHGAGRLWNTQVFTFSMIDNCNFDLIKALDERMKYFVETFVANNPEAH